MARFQPFAAVNMMLRHALLITGLLLTLSVAASPELRQAALTQLRSIAEPLFERGESTDPQFDQFYASMVETLPAQERAERALELAINRYAGAPEYVINEASSWRAQIKPSERLQALIETAINAPRLEVRMAGFELHLAQYGLRKSAREVDRQFARRAANPIEQGPWALWNLAILAARGVERERIYAELLLATADPDPAGRRWAVDALARFGGAEVIDPLLDLAVSDPSRLVAERAFCGVASSGTLLLAERYSAVPRLLAIVADPAMDAQMTGWGYQALREITSQYDLPEQPQVWQTRLANLGLLAEAAP